MISIKSQREIELMRKTCQLAAKTLEYIKGLLNANMSTEDVNQLCHDFIISHQAYPSPLNYKGFPKSICTSLNQVVCHGIPDSKVILKNGDILNIDVTTYLNKFHGDTNQTFLIGEVDPKIKKLVDVTYKAMWFGIKEVRAGVKLGNVGAAIQEFSEGHGFSVVRDYCGHGIGREFHEEPQVLHYGSRNSGVELRPGMTFTVEPMVNMGRPECRTLKDGWTAVTRDGSISAQFEHTLLVTEDGCEVLTLRSDESEPTDMH